MIINSKWTFQRKLNILADVLSQRLSIAQSAKMHEINPVIIKQWIEAIYQENLNLLDHQGGIFVKDENQRLKGFNETSTLVGTLRKPEIGLSDFDMTPERAAYYVANDVASIQSRGQIEYCESTYYSYFEWIDCSGTIYPILNDNGDVKATINVWNMNTNLNDLNFNVVVKTIVAGYAHLFIKKPSYLIYIDNRIIEFSNRHAECLLYLLIGIPIRIFSEHMGISAKTVEKMITIMNQKVGTTSSHQLVIALENAGFFAQL